MCISETVSIHVCAKLHGQISTWFTYHHAHWNGQFLSLVIEVWLICPSMNTPRRLSINEGSLFGLSHQDLSNHNGPHNPLGTVGKPSMRRVH
jgi:hypothetical protein